MKIFRGYQSSNSVSRLVLWALLLSIIVVIPTSVSTPASAATRSQLPTSAAVVTRPDAVSGTYTASSFANAITGVTGNGSEVTFTFNPAAKTGVGSDWRVSDFITVFFPSSNSTTTAYNLGQVAITAITTNTITVASTVKVDTAKYPNTVALTGLTSSSTGIRAGTLTVTRDPNNSSTPNGCSLGGTMTIAFGTNYLVPKYTSLGQAINNGSTVKIAAGSESVDQGVYGNTYQENKTVNGTVVSTLASCKGTLYIPEGVKSLSSAGQALVTNIAFPSTMEVVQANALSGYTSLVALNLDPVKYLMSSAFNSGCNISSLSLGPTFEFFGKAALQGCANLTAVALPASIRSLGEWTFGGSAVTYFDLPPGFTCTEPGLMKESGCDWKIGQYFFGGAPGSGYAILAPSIKINLGNIQSASTKLALQNYLGTQTLRGSITTTNDTNCTSGTVGACKTTTFVPNPSGNLIADGFGRTGMGYNVGNFPSVVFTQNSNEGPEKTFTQSVTSGANTQLSAASVMSYSKSNNTFVGWNTAADGSGTTYLDAASINITSTLYLYAQWSPIYTYTVNLNPGTGGTGTQMTAMTGTAATVVVNANTYSRTGYTFNGWNTAADGSGTSYTNQGTVRLTVDNQTITLHAQWSIITYTITYLPGPNGTSTSSAQTLNYGGSVTLKDASAGFTRIGYSIVGWTTSAVSGAAKTNDLGSTYSVLSSITLYPVWGVGVYAITYDGQGATTAASGGSTTYTTDAAIANIPTTAPLRTGYTFGGWFTAATGGVQVTNGSYTPSSPYGAITLYARWSVDVYAINFNYGSASSGSPLFAFETSTVSSTVARGLYTYGDPALTLPTVGSMIKTGYSFAGWVLPNGNLLSTSTFTPAATTTLTAKWTIQSFSLSYSRGTIGSDAVTGSTPASQSGNYLSTILLATTETSTVIAGQNYDFAGWTISGTRYPIGSSIQLGASNLIATATWVPVYTVTYILSGGVCISTVCNDNPKIDQSEVILPVAPSRTGFNFEAWKDQSGRSYLAGETLIVTATSYILTATWVGIERSVTYVNPNGVGIPTQGSGIYQSTFDVGVAPTRTGYDFGGWSDQGGVIFLPGDIYSVGLTNVTFTATWIPLGIVVTFFNNDGTSGSSTQSITAGTSTPLTQNALTRAGYNFGGWNTLSSGGGAPYSDMQNVSIVSPLNLYAQWTAITNNAITYDGQGATTPASGGSTTYTTATAIATIPTSAPVRSGYEFVGWFTASTGGIRVTNGSYTPSTPFGAITLYAQWTGLRYQLTFNGNNSTSGSAPASQSYVTGGSALTLPGNSGTLVRTGYTYAGWATAANGTGTTYTAAQTGVTLLADTILYANWIAKSIRTLSFGTTSYNKSYGETLTVTAALSIGTGTISYSRGTSTACTVNVITGLVTITNGSGSCVVSASVPEDLTYQAIETASSVVITVSKSLPATPTLGSVTSVDGVLKVAFTQSDSIENGITDYKYSIDGITYISVGSTTSPLSIPGLTPGTYTLRIIAVNSIGDSLPTAPVLVVVIAGPTVTITTPGGGGGGGGGVVYVPSGPSAAEIAAAQKAAVDKALADKAAADKAIADKAAADKAASDKAASDKAAADKVTADKAIADKAAADKAAADKAAADKAAADKVIADKLAADKSSAAEQFKSTCNLAQGSTAVISKSSKMKIYSQVCFVPDFMKPLEKDLVVIKSVITQLKSKKINSITLSSFADEKSGVNFKSVAQTRANVVAAMIKKANPKIKITYRLYGSSTKKNSLSLGRVVITA